MGALPPFNITQFALEPFTILGLIHWLIQKEHITHVESTIQDRDSLIEQSSHAMQ